MDNYQNVFSRYEKKYRLTLSQYNRMIEQLEQYMEIDMYGESDIISIYFDTPNCRLIRASIEKPVYKEKLRIRSYGIPGEDTQVYVELKKKYKSVVYKRRIGMPLFQAREYLYRKKKAQKPSQIEKEIDWTLDFYPNIGPSVLISYKRVSLFGIEDPGVRLTIDHNILYRNYDLELSSGIYGIPLLDNNEYLIEIKVPNAMPLWLTSILSGLQIYPASFSKYGNAYRELMQNTASQKRLRGRTKLATVI